MHNINHIHNHRVIGLHPFLGKLGHLNPKTHLGHRVGKNLMVGIISTLNSINIPSIPTSILSPSIFTTYETTIPIPIDYKSTTSLVIHSISSKIQSTTFSTTSESK